ncbi:MAG: heme-copper oxidase subunit III [Acidimicrobiia bacterium]
MTATETPALAQERTNKLGLWLFIASESMIFLALLAARFYLQGTDVPEHANQVIALIITSILLLSSISAYTAEVAYSHGDQRLFGRAMLATVVLGLAFLVGVVFEWAEAFEYFPPGTGFGTVFFSMTGMHAFHVVTGILFLGVVWRRGRAEPEGDPWPVEAGVKYWHFVDVVWVFFYPALYLIN